LRGDCGVWERVRNPLVVNTGGGEKNGGRPCWCSDRHVGRRETIIYRCWCGKPVRRRRRGHRWHDGLVRLRYDWDVPMWCRLQQRRVRISRCCYRHRRRLHARNERPISIRRRCCRWVNILCLRWCYRYDWHRIRLVHWRVRYDSGLWAGPPLLLLLLALTASSSTDSLCGWRGRPRRNPICWTRAWNSPVRARRKPPPKRIFVRTAVVCVHVRQTGGNLVRSPSFVIRVIYCSQSVSRRALTEGFIWYSPYTLFICSL